jgi:hypothetical protein
VKRYTVAVDFDGVLHQYVSAWVDAKTIPDPPVPGAIEWLHRIIQDFDVAVLSTRNHQIGGVRAMRAWLKRHADTIWYEAPGYRGLEEIEFPKEKPAALIYLDDRAIRFTGENWPSRQEIHEAYPWNKRKEVVP